MKGEDSINYPEAGEVVTRENKLQAQSKAPSVSTSEASLLLKINAGIPPELRRRLDELITLRQAEKLTSDQEQELLQLSSRIEALEAERLEGLAELARVRQMTLAELIDSLGLTAAENA